MSLASRVTALLKEACAPIQVAGQTWVVAVSGGPDSLCLLDILRQSHDALGVRLHVAHLDHQLRGEESCADAAFVASLCRDWRLPATIEARDVEAYHKRHRLSLEQAAREVRYAFLREVAEAHQAVAIALGHTADDNVESVLLHLLRGAGLRGLRGMSMVERPQGSSVAVVRPLIQATRQETEAYCKGHGLPIRIDSTNLSARFTRNRVRRDLLPALERFNPSVRQAILRLAQHARADLDYLQQAVDAQWKRIVSETEGGYEMRLEMLRALPPAVGRHLLAEALERLIGQERVESAHVEAMHALLGRPAGSVAHLPHGVVMARSYESTYLGREAYATCPLPPLDSEHTLRLSSIQRAGPWRVRARVVDRLTPLPPLHIMWRGGMRGGEACLDAALMKGQVTVRTRRPGDRFQPLGMTQAKKLQDFFVDARVPRLWRDRVPLVCAGGDIVWVVGWRISERYKVRETTRQTLVLRFEQK